MSKDMWDSGIRGHIGRNGAKRLARRIAFAECGSKTTAQAAFAAVFGSIQEVPTDFVQQLVITEESWIRQNTSETKQHSKLCVETGGLAPKRAKSIESSGKFMNGVFLDALSFPHFSEGWRVENHSPAQLRIQNCYTYTMRRLWKNIKPFLESFLDSSSDFEHFTDSQNISAVFCKQFIRAQKAKKLTICRCHTFVNNCFSVSQCYIMSR